MIVTSALWQSPKSPTTTTSAESAQPPVAVVNGVPISRQFFDFYLKGTTGAKNPTDVSADQREQLTHALGSRTGLHIRDCQRMIIGHEQDELGDTAFVRPIQLELSKRPVLAVRHLSVPET